jgi:cytochrome c biogenesis protein CcdA
VNLVELGCTLGLPAVYTRILSLREDLGPAARYGYLALYNVAYIVPLALIVVLYAHTMRRFFMTEKRAKLLKAISGALLLLFGLLFIAAPDVLTR